MCIPDDKVRLGDVPELHSYGSCVLESRLEAWSSPTTNEYTQLVSAGIWIFPQLSDRATNITRRKKMFAVGPISVASIRIHSQRLPSFQWDISEFCIYDRKRWRCIVLTQLASSCPSRIAVLPTLLCLPFLFTPGGSGREAFHGSEE